MREGVGWPRGREIREGGRKGGRGRTRVTSVGIRLGGALGDLEGVLGDDLVEGVFAAAEQLAGVTMT